MLFFGKRPHLPLHPLLYPFYSTPAGVNGYFPDGEGGKPWTDTSTSAATEFNNALPTVLATWDQEGTESAMQIRSVKVWQDVTL